jgi:hypothetical protein
MLIRFKERIPGIHQKDGGFFVSITIFLSPRGTTAPSGPGPPYYRGFTMTLKTHHTRQYSSGTVMSPKLRTLPDSTQLSQQTDFHYLCGIRTHNPRKRDVADLRLRQHGYWDRQYNNME